MATYDSYSASSYYSLRTPRGVSTVNYITYGEYFVEGPTIISGGGGVGNVYISGDSVVYDPGNYSGETTISYIVDVPYYEYDEYGNVISTYYMTETRELKVNVFIEGTIDEDFLEGSENGEQIVGSTGNDILNGNGGNDVLEGGEGDDILYGDTDVLDLDLSLSLLAYEYLATTNNSLINGLGGNVGFGEEIIFTNSDDGSSSPINISSVLGMNSLNFLGQSYSEIYINTNGTLSFGAENSGLSFNGAPMLMAFFDDIDLSDGIPTANTSGGNSQATNKIYFYTDADNGVITITWDDVGSYSMGVDQVNSFQIQIIKRGDVGDFDVIYRYEDIQWADNAQIGYTDGFTSYPLNTSNAVDVDTTFGNTGQAGIYILNVRNGVVQIPHTAIQSVPGSDTLLGGQGDDIYYVEVLGDVVTENVGEGVDTVRSYLSNYTLGSNLENLELQQNAGNINGSGNALNNILLGNNGNNVLQGFDGNDRLSGGLGNDILSGGLGADTLLGGQGDDIYYVEVLGDVVTENVGEGIDTVRSYLSNYTLGSNLENLELQQNAGNINGSGNALNNILLGNNGNNILDGGAGNDVYTAKAGGDTVIFHLLLSASATGGNGIDNWTDFQVGVAVDKIDISDLLIGYNGSNNQVYVDQFLSVESSGSNTNIYLDRDGVGTQFNDTLLITLDNLNTNLGTLLANSQLLLM